jgi:dipeptidyl aminopeptidase/acylaminoacyl peptidase
MSSRAHWRVARLTHTGEAVSLSGRAESLHYERRAADQGWLVYPRDFDAGKEVPMVVNVHGGPAGAVLPISRRICSASRYFVFFPNPRGSYGAGNLTRANVKDFGHGDLRDILAASTKR